MRPLIIITDATATGDDSIAIAMLLAARRQQVKLIIATSGNVWAEEAEANTRALLGKLGREDIQLCLGMSAAQFAAQRFPLIKSRIEARETAYAGAFGTPVPEAPANELSSEELFELIKQAGRPDLLILAPASPLAAIISRHADFGAHVGRAYLMGGAITGRGNATREAEFNFWFDAPAAETLLAANVPVTLLPLEVTEGLAYPRGFELGLDSDNPAARHVLSCISQRPDRPVCDEVLAAIFLEENLVTRRRALKLTVETGGPDRYGAVTILPETSPRRTIDVIEGIDQDGLWALIRDRVTMQQETRYGAVRSVV